MAEASQALFVTRMDGPEDRHPAELKHPTWTDIEASILRLDGDSCSLLILGVGPPPAPHMAIGGGDQGRYIVYVTPDNLVFHTLFNLQGPQGKCLVVAGGQQGEYDLEICVGLGEALAPPKLTPNRGNSTVAWCGKQCNCA